MNMVFATLMLLFVGFIVFLPSVITSNKGVRNEREITLCNIALGIFFWNLWLAGIAWAILMLYAIKVRLEKKSQ